MTMIGTIHINDPRLPALREAVADAVTTADLLLVEATATEEAAMQAAFAADPSLILITDGPTLPERLDPETWDAVQDAVRARQIPPFVVSKFQPWYLMLTLAIPPCAMPDIAAGQRGLDHMIMADAQAASVPVQALEPWDTLIRIMRTGSDAEQVDMLKLALLSPELQSEMFVAMLDSYFAGNLAELWEASRVSARYVTGMDPDTATAMFAQTEATILTARNLAWIPEINTALADHDSLAIAVGGAHLPGDAGLLNLLAAEGWVWTRLR